MRKLGYIWGFFWGMVAWIPLILVWVIYMIAELRLMSFEDALNDIGI